jgi:hypothetical protein
VNGPSLSCRRPLKILYPISPSPWPRRSR